MRGPISTWQAAFPRFGAVALAASLAAVAFVSGCGGSSSSSTGTSTAAPAPSTLNTQRVAAAITQSIFKQRHLHATVNCPTGIPQVKGETFTCTASTTSKGKKTVTTPFKVTVVNARGFVTYVGL